MHIICRNVKVPLNFVRERIKHVYGTILLGIPVKKNHRLSSIVEGDRGAGARENRGREGYGRREKKGREAGSL